MREILIYPEKCNGCLTCQTACSVAHSKSGTVIGAILEKVQPRLTVEAVGAVAIPLMCRHCEEPACVDACMTGAMQKDKDTGIVTNEGHPQKCVGCWMCVMSCPYGAISRSTGAEAVAIKCDRCTGREIPACVESCPNGALEFGEIDALGDKRRKQTARSVKKGLDQMEAS
ncbi:MAG: 4Fe-4S dicluster domain-containing protein [Bacillota bacterium]|nr:4Fe-4S dicluster domain-containing protein [Bacillota bacterium]